MDSGQIKRTSKNTAHLTHPSFLFYASFHLNLIHKPRNIYTPREGRQVHVSNQEWKTRQRNPHRIHDLHLIFRLQLRLLRDVEHEICACLEPEFIIWLDPLQVNASLLSQLSHACLKRQLGGITVALRKGPLAALSASDHNRLVIL